MTAEKFNSFDQADIDIIGKKSNFNNDIYTTCPKCRGDHKGKRPTLGVKVPENYGRCNRCGWTFFIAEKGRMKPEVIPVIINEEEMPPKVIKWYKESRGISEDTIKKCHIGFEKNIYIKDRKTGKGKSTGCIAYKYYRNGVLLMVKYRDQNKNFKIVKPEGQQLIMYGLDDIKGNDTCIIVEGEEDKHAYAEAGLMNVVSAPNGATILPKEKKHFEETGELISENVQNLAYLDECYEYFEDKKTIYIATDDDAPGFKLQEELVRRLGKHRCKKISFSGFKKPDDKPCKDANDVLIHHGKESLVETLNNAIEYPIEHVVTINSIKDKILHAYSYGKIKGKSLGWEGIDENFSIKIGETTGINGYPNMGKTNLALNIAINMAYLYKWPSGIYSSENPVEDLVDNMLEIILGNSTDMEIEGRAKLFEVEAATTWLNKYIYFIEPDQSFTPKELRDKAEELVRKHGIKMFFKDPWNSLTHNYGANGYNGYLEHELSEEVRFGMRNQVANFICVHPPTPERNQFPPAPTQYMITGGSMWPNKLHNIICKHIPYGLPKEDPSFEFHSQKIKNHKLVGYPTIRDGGPKTMEYNFRHGRITDQGKSPIENLRKEILGKQSEIEGF